MKENAEKDLNSTLDKNESPDTVAGKTPSTSDGKIPSISFGIFFSEINNKKKVGSFIILINFVRDCLIPFLIIMLINIPFFQISSILAFMAIRLVFLVTTFPYTSKWTNIKELLSEIFYVIILGLHFALHLL